MRAIHLITLALLTLMNLPFNACAKDDDGHTLTKLWAAYEKAVEADKPKDQADILTQIKKEASAQHLAWDYYDACWKYVDARVSTNWKLRDELRAQADDEIERFGEPVAIYYNNKSSRSSTYLRDYVVGQKERMLQAHNPEFYGRDGNVTGFHYADALLPLLQNDYEYAVWSLFGRFRDPETLRFTREQFAGRYPFDAFIDFTDIARRYDGDAAIAKMEDFAREHAGQAVALLGREYALD